ncbi:hypothetical protein [Runella zeae]|uniref:hypothetical protein n=1 Tax=Runella zeae TaxID=94255 RepID=UPI00041CF1B6|nr:hypothetical protein [Runella zeae]
MQTHIAGRKYDSSLTIQGHTAQLTLEMNIQFVAIDGNSSVPGRLRIIQTPEWTFEGITQNGELRDRHGVFPLCQWNHSSEFVPLQQKLLNAIETAWDNQYWLNPARGWYRNEALNYDEALPVLCRVKVKDVSANPHFTAYCIKPDPSREHSANFRSYVSNRGHWGVFTIHDAQTLEFPFPSEGSTPTDDNKDGIYDRDVPFAYRQVTVAHEFSHMIGLHHVNGQGNESWRYGVNDSQRRQISGMGMEILPHHMRPWSNRLNQHIAPKRTRWEFSHHPQRYFWQRGHLRIWGA